MKEIDASRDLELRLLKAMFLAGQEWLKGLKASSWAKECYAGGRSTLPLYDNDTKLAYTIKDATSEQPPSEYLVLPPDPGAVKEVHPTVTLMRVVPSEGATKKVPRHLNFHVCCHTRNRAGVDFVVGWRIEGPEGDGSDHNFCHVQPLQKLESFADDCFPVWMPHRFPTIPIAANSGFEATLAACLASSGKTAVLRSVNPYADLRPAVDDYIRRIETRS